jgi:hypothetical protein
MKRKAKALADVLKTIDRLTFRENLNAFKDAPSAYNVRGRVVCALHGQKQICTAPSDSGLLQFVEDVVNLEVV